MVAKSLKRRRGPSISSLLQGQSRKKFLGGSGAALWAGGKGSHLHQKPHSGLLALIKSHESLALFNSL